jgi:hypothetical protein
MKPPPRRAREAGGRKGRPYGAKGTVVGDFGEVERLAVPAPRLFR